MADNFEAYKNQRLDITARNYEIAIKYYLELKHTFIKSLSETSQQVGQKLKKQEFKNIINNGVLDADKDIGYVAILDEYLKAIEQQWQSMNNNSLKKDLLTAMREAKESHKTDGTIKEFKTYWKEVSNSFDEIFTSYQMMESIQNTALSLLDNTTQHLGLGSLNNSHSITGAYGFFKRTVMNSLIKDYNSSHKGNFLQGKYAKWQNDILSAKAKSGYGNVIGGYIRESLVRQSIESFLQKNKSAFQTFSSTANNPHYDIVIGSTSIGNNNMERLLTEELDDIENLFSGEASINKEMLEAEIPAQYFGIQSKSWQAPRTLLEKGKSLREQWFKIGDRENILSMMPGAKSRPEDFSWDRGWHNYVAICSKNIYSLIGQYQVAYGLRGEFVWTYDLIQQMRNNNMYLNFYFTRERNKEGQGIFHYPATAELVWQKRMFLYTSYTAEALRELKNR